MWSKLAAGPAHCLIVAEKREPVVCAKGLSVNPHVSFADCPPLDYLLVPGGMGTRREVDNPAMVRFLAAQAPGCKALLSVCTGAFVLHAAGLLSGKTATTHWGSLDRLRALGDVKVVEQRFVQDGDVWTSAGVIGRYRPDAGLHCPHGRRGAAAKVQLQAEYYPADTVYGSTASHERAPAYVRRPARRAGNP